MSQVSQSIEQDDNYNCNPRTVTTTVTPSRAQQPHYVTIFGQETYAGAAPCPSSRRITLLPVGEGCPTQAYPLESVSRAPPPALSTCPLNMWYSLHAGNPHPLACPMSPCCWGLCEARDHYLRDVPKLWQRLRPTSTEPNIHRSHARMDGCCRVLLNGCCSTVATNEAPCPPGYPLLCSTGVSPSFYVLPPSRASSSSESWTSGRNRLAHILMPQMWLRVNVKMHVRPPWQGQVANQ